MAKIDAAASDLTSDIRGVSFSKHILSIGSAQFIREISIPLLDAIEKLNENYPISPTEEEWSLDVTTDFDHNQVYAKSKALAGFFAIIIFIGGWGATKILDELYEIAIKDKVHDALQGFFKSNASGRKVGSSLLVNMEPKRISILIATVGKDLNEFKHSQSQVGPVIARAIDTAEKIATPGTVHLYVIEAGNVNHYPLIYGSIAEAIGHVRD